VADKQTFVVGKVDEFPPGAPRILEVGGRSIGVYNVDGSFYAVQNVCLTRSGRSAAALSAARFSLQRRGVGSFGLENRVVRCPHHRWEFDITNGESIMGVDRRRLLTFP